MKKTITRITGIMSIALLAGVVGTVPLSSASPNFEPASVVQQYPEVLEKRAQLPAIQLPREYRVAISKDAKDRKGYKKSLYRGKYYYADQENWRKCVMDRESNFSYTSRSSISTASGAYQFLDSQWRDGLVHMMIKESKKKDHGLEKKLRAHFDKPIQTWNRYFQDRAFFTALNYNGKWSGKHHWNATVPGTSC